MTSIANYLDCSILKFYSFCYQNSKYKFYTYTGILLLRRIVTYSVEETQGKREKEGNKGKHFTAVAQHESAVLLKCQN